MALGCGMAQIVARRLAVRSVADPGCLSRIPDPEFYGSDPKTAMKDRGEKICCNTFFWSHKFHKI